MPKPHKLTVDNFLNYLERKCDELEILLRLSMPLIRIVKHVMIQFSMVVSILELPVYY